MRKLDRGVSGGTEDPVLQEAEANPARQGEF